MVLIAGNQNVLIVGLARNCELTIRDSIDRLQASFADFRSVHFFVVESDSSDKTVSVLGDLTSSSDYSLQFLSLGNLSKSLPIRTERIAKCRNAYMDFFENFYLENDIDLLVVADLDGVNSFLNIDAVRSILTREDWDGCTANQLGAYYDIWALRHPYWSPNDCWQMESFLCGVGLNRFKARQIAVYDRMWRIPLNSEWIPVESAFGGLAVYKAKAVVGLRYAGLTSVGKEICEHVSFNYDFIKRGGNLYINPKLINDNWNEHNEPMKYKKRVKRFIKRYLLSSLEYVGTKFYEK